VLAPPSTVQFFESSRDQLPFKFVRISEENPTLPELSGGFFSLVTSLMSLNRIARVEQLLTELHRLLVPSGCLAIREHDCPSDSDFALILDLAHGLFALVWSDPMEDPDFLSSYSASYRSRDEWRELISRHGFELVQNPYPLNVSGAYRAYIDVFRKIQTPVATPSPVKTASASSPPLPSPSPAPRSGLPAPKRRGPPPPKRRGHPPPKRRAGPPPPKRRRPPSTATADTDTSSPPAKRKRAEEKK